ncbi:MAG TPA: hypothetical protein VHP83_15935 [Aggregatilineaceae bacterium]|nr:hypothetical protein [Aggregatilineaceae bacterium]
MSDLSPWRVLIVDDRPAFAAEVRRIASLFNCNLVAVPDLIGAIRVIRRMPPHLILLDLHLPSDDEWEPSPELQKKYDPTQKSLAFCEIVTTHPTLSSITICVVSVDNQPAQMETVKQAGAHAFCLKSDFNVDFFEKLLQHIASSFTPSTSPD